MRPRLSLKSLAIWVAGVSLLIQAIPAAAGPVKTISATVRIGHPGTAQGIAETAFYLSGCDVSPHQGVDGWVIDLEGGGSVYSLQVDNPSTPISFANIVFYEPTAQGCRYRQGFWNQPLPIRNRQIPGGARWAVVSFPYGLEIAFTCNWL